MKINRYWHRMEETVTTDKGEEVPIAVYGGSPDSEEGARRDAEARLERLERRTKEGLHEFHVGNREYGMYSDRPLREQLLDELYDDRGELIGAITRNAYGAKVLNTAKVMFIDIDLEDFESPQKAAKPKQKKPGFFARLFGGGANPMLADSRQEEEIVETQTPEQKALEQLREVGRDAGLNIRVYRTAAGLRGLVMSHTFDPTDSAALGLLRAFKSDPLYIKLCEVQECFRARLEPKPWRVGCGAPFVKFPFAHKSHADSLERWVKDYYSRYDEKVGVCRFIDDIEGRPGEMVHPEVHPILTRHDDLCRNDSAQKLA